MPRESQMLRVYFLLPLNYSQSCVYFLLPLSYSPSCVYFLWRHGTFTEINVPFISFIFSTLENAFLKSFRRIQFTLLSKNFRRICKSIKERDFHVYLLVCHVQDSYCTLREKPHDRPTDLFFRLNTLCTHLSGSNFSLETVLKDLWHSRKTSVNNLPYYNLILSNLANIRT